jgi:TRAP-type C4-dicarboxylate transport system permease small subunit
MREKKIPLYLKPEKFIKFFAWVCAGVMLFNMMLITCDVLLRYLFNSPIQGATEVATMMMAWIAYTGLAYALMTGQHMQLGAIYDKLTGRKLFVFSFVIYLFGLILYCLMSYASFKLFWSSYLINEKAVAAVTVYVWIGKFGAVLGWVLLAIQSVFMVAYSIEGIMHPETTAPIFHKSELPDHEDMFIIS